MELTESQKENLKIDLQIQKERHGLYRKTMTPFDISQAGGFGIRRKTPEKKKIKNPDSSEVKY